MSIKELMQKGAAAYDSRDRFDPEVRRKWVNASEIGTCIRKQWYAKHQPELSEPESWGYARRGINAERYMVETMLLANAPLRYAGDEQETLQEPETKISATPDGALVWDIETWEGVEFKSIDPRVNVSDLPRAAHVTQLKIGMELMRWVHFDGVAPTHGTILYIDASDFDKIHEHRVEYDPDILDKVEARANKIMRTKKVENMDREGAREHLKKQCKTCNFTGPCGVDIPLPADDPAKGNRNSALYAAVEDLQLVKEIKKREADAKETVKAELRARKVNKIVVGEYIVTLSPVAGRKTLDKKAVAAAGIDLSPFEKTGAPSERLNVDRVT